jgi:hypothetical protein
MSPTLEQIRDMLRRHTPRLSRRRMVVLLFIAGIFIWVLMGSRRGEDV